MCVCQGPSRKEILIAYLKDQLKGREGQCSSIVKGLPSLNEDLDSTPSTLNSKQNQLPPTSQPEDALKDAQVMLK